MSRVSYSNQITLSGGIMNYGNILSSAWKTVWKHKVIFYFGILVAILPALFGIIYGGAYMYFAPNFIANLETFADSPASMPEPNLVLIIVAVVAYFVFIALIIVISALSDAAVIKGTLLAQESSEEISFSDLWQSSKPYIWRIVGLTLLAGFAMFVVFMVPWFLFALIGIFTMGIGFLCMIPFMLLMIPLVAIWYLLQTLSSVAIVAEDMGIFESIQHAWKLLKKKFWPLVLMGIILYIILIAISMIVIVPMQIVQFSYTSAFTTPNYMNDPADFAEIFRRSGLISMIFTPLSAFAQAIAMTYINAAFALTYLDITAEPENDEEVIEYA